MHIINWFIVVSISIVALSHFTGDAIALDNQATIETNIPEGLGELLDGVLHVSATEAASLMKDNPEIKVLDVRTAWEYNRGHIEGAVLINYYWFGFEEKLATLDKNATWIVHCKVGVRSGNTLPKMKKAGFTSIIHMDGGIDDWREAMLPETESD